jgi:hypothetical protein
MVEEHDVIKMSVIMLQERGMINVHNTVVDHDALKLDARMEQEA